MHKWPEYIETDIDAKLEKNISIVQNVIQSILAGREKLQRGIRWPLKEVIITSKNKNVVEAIEKLQIAQAAADDKIEAQLIQLIEKMGYLTAKAESLEKGMDTTIQFIQALEIDHGKNSSP